MGYDFMLLSDDNAASPVLDAAARRGLAVLQECFWSFLAEHYPRVARRDIEMLTAQHFFGIVPLHGDHPERQVRYIRAAAALLRRQAQLGVLWAVCGPSGAGKDTLVAGARACCGANFVFGRKHVTGRVAEKCSPLECPVSPEVFRARAAAGGWLLSWEKNGHSYGFRSTLSEDLALGRNVVLIVSRGELDRLRQRFGACVRVLSILADPEVTRSRILERQRSGGCDGAPDRTEERVRQAKALGAPEGTYTSARPLPLSATPLSLHCAPLCVLPCMGTGPHQDLGVRA